MGIEHRPHLNASAMRLEKGVENGGALQLELLEQELLAGGCDQIHNRLPPVLGHHKQTLVGVAHGVSAARAARYLTFHWLHGFNLLPPQVKP
ncbi:MAG: hypothetical protein ACK5GZ_10905 [Cyanobium sp.]